MIRIQDNNIDNIGFKVSWKKYLAPVASPCSGLLLRPTISKFPWPNLILHRPSQVGHQPWRSPAVGQQEKDRNSNKAESQAGAATWQGKPPINPVGGSSRRSDIWSFRMSEKIGQFGTSPSWALWEMMDLEKGSISTSTSRSLVFDNLKKCSGPHAA